MLLSCLEAFHPFFCYTIAISSQCWTLKSASIRQWSYWHLPCSSDLRIHGRDVLFAVALDLLWLSVFQRSYWTLDYLVFIGGPHIFITISSLGWVQLHGRYRLEMRQRTSSLKLRPWEALTSQRRGVIMAMKHETWGWPDDRMTLGESARASMARRKLIKARAKPKSGLMILQRQANRMMEGNFQLPLDAMALDCWTSSKRITKDLLASLAKALAKMYATWSLAGRPFARSTNTTQCCLTNTWASYASCWSTLSAWLGGYKILQVYVHSLEGPSYLKMWKNGFASTTWSSEPKILAWTKTGIERPVESSKLCRLRGERDWRDLHGSGRASRTSRWSRASRRRTNRASIPDEDVLDEHEMAEISNAIVQQKCKTFT